MANKSEIGGRLRDFAIKNYGSVANLERSIGISQNGLSTYISGRTGVGAKLQDKLRKAGCDIEWLMTGADKIQIAFKEQIASYQVVHRISVTDAAEMVSEWMRNGTEEDAELLELIARKIYNVK